MPYKDAERRAQARRESALRNQDKIAEARHARRKNYRSVIAEYKEQHPCADCGEFYPHYVMDLDHRDPAEKLTNLAKMAQRYGLETILAEIAKCDVVCANCHRVRTHNQKEAGIIQ